MQPATHPAAITAISPSSAEQGPSKATSLTPLPGANFERALADHIAAADNPAQTPTMKAATVSHPDFPLHTPTQSEPDPVLWNQFQPTDGTPGGTLPRAPRLVLLPIPEPVPLLRETAAADPTNENAGKATARGSAGKSGESKVDPASLLPASTPGVHSDLAGLPLELAGQLPLLTVTPGLPPKPSVPVAGASTTDQVPVLNKQAFAPVKPEISDIDSGAAQNQAGDDIAAVAQRSGFSQYLTSQPEAAAPLVGHSSRNEAAAEADARESAAESNRTVESAPAASTNPEPKATPQAAGHTPVGNQPASPAAHQGGSMTSPAAIAPSAAQAQPSPAFTESREAGVDVGTVPSGAPHAPADFAALPVNPYQKLDQLSAAQPPVVHIGANRVAVGLNDPALGWVEIKTQSAAGQVVASFVTASHQTNEALAAQLPSLAQFLADREVKVGSLTVDQQTAGGRDGNQAGGGYEQGSNRGHSGDGAQSGWNDGPQLPVGDPGPDAGVELRPLSYISVLA